MIRRHDHPVDTVHRRLIYLLAGAAFTVLSIASAYLALVSVLQWIADEALEGALYQYAFLIHLLLGLVVCLATLVYIGTGLRRMQNASGWRRAWTGFASFVALAVIVVTGVLLLRVWGGAVEGSPRSLILLVHVAAPFLAAWAFVVYRRDELRICWPRTAAFVVLCTAAVVVVIFSTLPRSGDTPGKDYPPSLARTVDPGGIDASDLLRDDYCGRCHSDLLAQHRRSAHRFASLDNPAYRFAVLETRRKLNDRDGDVSASRHCAGCHDPVPLFSGAFDDSTFDAEHPLASAGITCLVCHAVDRIDDVRGNGSYVLGTPQHYPFAFAEPEFARSLSDFLIRSNPGFHKRSFLKPLHETPEFCGSCHKVHLPEELNGYRWLRGQNHYDSFLLSGVSGHAVDSFYYPDTAVPTCATCHMRGVAATDPSARIDADGVPTVKGHGFAAANTALPFLMGLGEEAIDPHVAMLRDTLSVDVFAARRAIGSNEDLIAPLHGARLKADSYVIDVVVRNRAVGHAFTQGTADSNEVWLDVEVFLDGEPVAASGQLNATTKAVEPGAHFFNAYQLDRVGKRIDRRNVDDFLTTLYNHQIPPGAADTISYRLDIPSGRVGVLAIEARVRYRKFDTTFFRLFTDDPDAANELPIVALAEGRAEVALGDITPTTITSDATPLWQRWNDYGIGFLRKQERGALRQAESAFTEVASLGRSEGHLNLARVWLEEGRLEEATEALAKAAQGANAWSIAWFSGLLSFQTGNFDSAIGAFEALRATDFVAARSRGFDFSRDYRLRNMLARAYFERSKIGASHDRGADLERARDEYQATLSIDPENAVAHFGLTQVYRALESPALAENHQRLHDSYRVDHNARDEAIAAARRRDPHANRAADAVVIYELVPRGRDDDGA